MKINTIVANAIAISAFFMAAGVRAESFSGTYSETYNASTTGLQIAVNPLQTGSALSFALNPGQSTTVDIFDLYTPESTVNGDDTTPQAISTLFSFLGASDKAVDGLTVGVKDTDGNAFFGIPGNHQYGQVTWNGAESIAFSDGSVLDVALNDTRFNEGEYYALDYGSYPYSGTAESNGADIVATFTLENVSAAPEPSTWALMMTSIGAIGLILRRNRQRQALSFTGGLSA